jgi:hypothetical protein
MLIKSLPHCDAKYFARLKSINGSFSLATTIEKKGNNPIGIGAKLRTTSGVYAGESTSVGATSRALNQMYLSQNSHKAIWHFYYLK